MKRFPPYSDSAYWAQLCERYFDALTTPAEERALRRFLASPEGCAPQFDDVRHTVGYLIAVQRAQQSGRAARLPHRRLRRLVAAAAVTVLLAGGATGIGLWRHNNVCVAYVDGRKITSPEGVLHVARHSLRQVAPPPARPTMESQLDDMFRTLPESVP